MTHNSRILSFDLEEYEREGLEYIINDLEEKVKNLKRLHHFFEVRKEVKEGDNGELECKGFVKYDFYHYMLKDDHWLELHTDEHILKELKSKGIMVKKIEENELPSTMKSDESNDEGENEEEEEKSDEEESTGPKESEDEKSESDESNNVESEEDEKSE